MKGSEEMRYKNIICKYCGEKAQVPTLRKQNYCNKENCKMLAHNEVARKHYHAQKNDATTNSDYYKAKLLENDVVSKAKIGINSNVKKTIAERKVSPKVAENLYYDDIMQIALDMGNCRYRLIQLIKEEIKKEKDYNKQDDILLHKLEFEDLSREETGEIIDQLIIDRPNRRSLKVRRQMIDWLLVYSPIKNPSAFVKAAVKGAGTTRHFDKYLEELKNDPTIFAQKKE